MPLEIASPGDLARLLRGQDLVGLRQLQASGLARFDGGLAAVSPASVDGVPVNSVLLDLVENSDANVNSLVLALPRSGRTLIIEIEAHSDQGAGQGLLLTFNDDAGANHFSHSFQVTGVGAPGAGFGTAGAASARCGVLATSGVNAGTEPYSHIRVANADSTVKRKTWHYVGEQWVADAVANATLEMGHGMWINKTDPIRGVKFTATTGGFAYIRARLYVLA